MRDPGTLAEEGPLTAGDRVWWDEGAAIGYR